MAFYYPYVKERYKAFFIDTLAIIGFMVVISIVLSFFETVPDEVRIVCFSLLFLYEPICVSFGATIGQMSNKIRVRNNNDPSKRLNFFIALWRSAVKYIMGIVSLLFINGNPKRRALHDFLSNSVIISLSAEHFVEEEDEQTDESQPEENSTYF